MCHSSTCWNVWPINGNCWWDLHQFPGLWPNCANWHWDGQWQVRYAPWQSWMTKTRQMNKRLKFLTLNFQDWMTLLAHPVCLISLPQWKKQEIKYFGKKFVKPAITLISRNFRVLFYGVEYNLSGLRFKYLPILIRGLQGPITDCTSPLKVASFTPAAAILLAS